MDTSAIRQPFIARVRPGGRVLDAGCGSGRDSKAFLDAGFTVSAFDQSREMVRLARAYTGLDVRRCSFLEYECGDPFDGIWACASLLHVRRAELPRTIAHLAGLLHPRGVLYASLKLGGGERLDGERYFNDVTPEDLQAMMARVPTVSMESVWITPGLQHPDARWVNALLRPI